MKDTLEKFPKYVLIEFIRRKIGLYSLGSVQKLEAELLSFQWEIDSKQTLAEMFAASDEMAAANGDRTRWIAANQLWEKARQRHDKADKLLDKSRQLRGFRNE